VFQPRPVRVQAVIERPPAPPWCEVPFPERVAEWHGWLLAWRWTDATRTSWTGLVRYQRDGLGYEHWVSGELLTVEPAAESTATDDPPAAV
jgi:hypothetical protein